MKIIIFAKISEGAIARFAYSGFWRCLPYEARTTETKKKTVQNLSPLLPANNGHCYDDRTNDDG